MGKLFIYLPPFAADYSGVCASLYDLDCLTIMNDASCCTGSYVYWDEPRWDQSPGLVLSSQLRNKDAVLGNTNKLKREILYAVSCCHPRMLALVGTPVPAITGMDMEGFAMELEQETGIMCFGFQTSGFQYYDRGIFAAEKALISRFAVKETPVSKGLVNLLGVTPLDFGDGQNASEFRMHPESLGYRVGNTLSLGAGEGGLDQLCAAEYNIAVSAGGLLTAKWMKKRFGTPYVAMTPMSVEQSDLVLSGGEITGPEYQQRLLYVGDQVIGVSLRRELILRKIPVSLDIASFFSWDADIAEPADLWLRDEKSLLTLLKKRDYAGLIADPLFDSLPPVREKRLQLLEMVHPAASGTLYRQRIPDFMHLFGE